MVDFQEALEILVYLRSLAEPLRVGTSRVVCGILKVVQSISEDMPQAASPASLETSEMYYAYDVR